MTNPYLFDSMCQNIIKQIQFPTLNFSSLSSSSLIDFIGSNHLKTLCQIVCERKKKRTFDAKEFENVFQSNEDYLTPQIGFV